MLLYEAKGKEGYVMKKLMILGAGGHGRVIAECTKLLGEYSEISFLDDVEPKKQLDYSYYWCIRECI